MDPRIQWARTELEQRIAEPLTVAEMAEAVNLSPSRFAHLFRDETGVSPMRYLHTQRMVRARALLERTFLTVKQVMAQVGCADPSHFARDFRRFHGMAPSECRAAGGPARVTPWTRATAADVPRPP